MENKVYLKIIILLLTLSNAVAQSHITENKFVSGNYDIFKVWCDADAKHFTMLTDITEENIGCKLFITGIIENREPATYRIKGYPFGEEGSFYNGILRFHNGGIEIKLKETGSCQIRYNFEKGAFFSFEKGRPYHKFGMINSKKAIMFSKRSSGAYKKGHLLQGDLVSIIDENRQFCKVRTEKKPSFNAWVKKSDIIY